MRIWVVVALAATSPLFAGGKKDAATASTSAPAPVARGSVAGRGTNLPQYSNGQRLGAAYRGQPLPSGLRYSPSVAAAISQARLRNFQTPARPRVETATAVAANANLSVARSFPTRDAADDIIATIPRHRRDGSAKGDRNTNAATPSAPVTSATGSKSNIPASTFNPGRHHAGGGKGVVPFNNDTNVTFNDANGRCHDWRNHGGDRNWWHRRCPVIILIGGGYWGWNDGWWYPAWGYSNYYSTYAYEGPIYGYDGLPPDQVVANVQGALQEIGYFQYAVDGVLGPATQAAIADFQRDNGLYVTGAIDRATLSALGFIS